EYTADGADLLRARHLLLPVCLWLLLLTLNLLRLRPLLLFRSRMLLRLIFVPIYGRLLLLRRLLLFRYVLDLPIVSHAQTPFRIAIRMTLMQRRQAIAHPHPSPRQASTADGADPLHPPHPLSRCPLRLTRLLPQPRPHLLPGPFLVRSTCAFQCPASGDTEQPVPSGSVAI
ncbi:hypothetical protein C8F01DRAFT_1176884, partial [Mycena amicta]